MSVQRSSKVIRDNPIGNGLDDFRASFNSICQGAASPVLQTRLSVLVRKVRQSTQHRPGVPSDYHIDLRTLVLAFLSVTQNLPAARLLPARTGRGTLRSDLLRLELSLDPDDFNLDRIKPPLRLALAGEPDDTDIWNHLYEAVTESTPPPRPIPSSIQQTPLSQNTSGLVNSSEFRQNVDPILKLELEHLYAGLPNFHKAFFGDVPDLDRVSEAVFRRCTDGDHPLFTDGWNGWPATAKESEVLLGLVA